MTQDPMSLENLSSHLKSLREAGDMETPTVVEMGQIVVGENRSMRWIKRIGYALLVFMTLGIGSVATYKLAYTDHFTIIADLDPAAITQLVSDSGGQIVSIEKRDGSTYEVKAVTRESRPKFLEWLRKHKGIRKADFEE